MDENLAPRIGTAEKERALTLLNEHHAAGRIDFREFDLRSQKIANAVTQADLDAVFSDLQAPAGARRNRWPLAAAVLGVVCVLLIVAVVVLVQRGSSSPAAVVTTAIPPVPSTAVPTSERVSTTAQSVTTTSTSTTTGPALSGSTDAVQYFMDFKPLSGGKYWSMDTGPATVSGTPYIRSVMLEPRLRELAFVEYDLGRKFTRLDGVLGVRDDSTPSDIAMQFQIYADGVLVTDTTVKLGATAPIHLEFDKPLRLRLQVTDLSGGGDSMGVFGDLRATR